MAAPAQSIQDLLADAGIKVKSFRPGHAEHVICPKCEGGTSREASLSVKVDADGQGATWTCHRGSCGWKDGGRVHSDGPYTPRHPVVEPPRPIQKPKPHAPAQKENRPDWLHAFFGERNIGDRTVQAFGVYATGAWFPQLKAEAEAVVFPFVWKGELVNRKYRTRPDQKFFTQDKDSLPTLFNVDRLGEAPEEIVWVEGEMDVMALFECQIENAITLKDGAPKEATFKEDDKRFEALRTHADLLAKPKRIVLAGDMDAPGLALREELARRLGRHRCWLVTWPEGCKDAADTLRAHGPDAVQAAIQSAVRYPISGLQQIKTGSLLALRQNPPPATMTTGAGATDEIIALPTEGRLIVVTGFPNHGKALALDTLVPTPSGWTTMGEIQDGDTVYAADGSTTRVVKAHPVMEGRECLRVTFSDGETFVCDAEHLWFTWTASARISARHHRQNRAGREHTLLRGTDQRHLRKLPCAVTAREIADTLTVGDGPGKRRFNHSVPVALPVPAGNPWPIAVRPYTLGAWLGDGTSESAGLTSADPEIPHQIRADGYEVKKNGHVLSWYIHGLKGQLREAGVLGNKHIPAACLRAPVEDRLALLQGLMDTDGYLDVNGAEFCTMRPELGDAVAELISTLGMKAKIYRGRATINGKDCGEKTRVCFIPTMPVFRLARKLANCKKINPGIRSKFRTIVAVDPVETQPVRCITVDNPDSLYLIGKRFIPTHNTSWTKFVMVHTAERHDRRWAVFSPEMQPWEHFTAECAEVLIGRPFWRKEDQNGQPIAAMSDTDVMKAEQWLAKHMTMLVCDAEDEAPTLDWIIERATSAVLRDGITDLLIDPWNEIDQQRAGASETDYIGRGLQRLKAFGQRHGCNVWIIAHPAKPPQLKPGEKLDVPGPYSISGSAHWANKTDLGITVHAPDPHACQSEVHMWKARFQRFGTRGCNAKLDFHKATGRYTSAPTAHVPNSPHWQDS